MSRTHKDAGGRRGGEWREEVRLDAYEISDDGVTLEQAVRGASRWADWSEGRKAARHGRVR